MIRRSLLTICSIISLVLWIGTIVLWPRSYWRSDEIFRLQSNPAGFQEYGVSLYKGCFCFFRNYAPPRSEMRDAWIFMIGMPARTTTSAG